MQATDESSPSIDWQASEGFLRSLIRGMVRDADVAEDLSQETVRIALERPPASGDVNRRWLTGVAKNMVRRHWQQRAQRRLSSGQAAEPVDAQTPEATYWKRLALDGVARAMEILPEPHKTALLASYYEGCSTSELAQRLGVSAAAASKRKARAKEELRRLLDARFGGAGASWQAVLATVMFRPELIQAGGSAAASGPEVSHRRIGGPGRALSPARLAVVILAPLTIASGLMVWLIRAPDAEAIAIAEDASPSEAVALDDDGAAVAPFDPAASGVVLEGGGVSADRAALEGSGDLPEAASPDLTHCRIKVIDQTGNPIGGAAIEDWTSHPNSAGHGAVLATTDADGNAAFSLAVIEDNRELAREWRRLLEEHGRERAYQLVERRRKFWLRIRRPGFATIYQPTRLVPGDTFSLGPYVMSEGQRIQGRITEPTGAPVSGAYVLAGSSGGEIAGLIRSAREQCALRSLSIATPRELADKVWANRLMIGRADANGDYVIDGVPTGPISLIAAAEGGLRRVVMEGLETDTGEGQFVQDIHLPSVSPAEHVTGRVVGPDGTPRAAAQVVARSGSCRISSFSDADGRFRVATSVGSSCRHEESWTIEVTDAAGATRPAVRTGVSPGTRDLLVELEDREFLAILVRDAESGRVLHDWSGMFVAPGGTPPASLLHRPRIRASDLLTRSAGDEEPADPVLLLPLPGKAATLAIWAPSFGLTTVDLDPAPGELLEITLTPSPGVQGRVTAEGEPVVGARVRMLRLQATRPMRRDGLPTYLAFDPEPPDSLVQEDGSFRTELWLPGEYLLVASADGYADSYLRLPPLAPAEGISGVELELHRGATVEVQVVGLPAGVDLSEVIVRLDHPERRTISTNADHRGLATFSLVPLGEWRVTAEHFRRELDDRESLDEASRRRKRELGDLVKWMASFRSVDGGTVQVQIQPWNR